MEAVDRASSCEVESVDEAVDSVEALEVFFGLRCC